MVTSQSLGFGPAIKAGLFEAFNPGGLVGIVLFVYFLYFILRGNGFVWRIGLPFIFGNGIGKWWLFEGYGDFLLANKVFLHVVGFAYLCCAIAGIIIGGSFLRDWWRLTLRRDGAVLFIPLTDAEKRAESKRCSVTSFVISFVLGFILALFQSIWGQDKMVAVCLMQMLSPGGQPSVFMNRLVYVLSVVWGLVFTAAVFLYVMKDKTGVAFLRRYPRLIRVILAAALIGFNVSFLIAYGQEMSGFIF